MTLRAYAPYVVVTLAVLALALLIAKLAPVLLLGFAGVVFASVIRAASTPLEKRLGLNSTIAVAIAALAIAALFALFGFLFGRQLMAQTTELWSAVQDAGAKLQEHVSDSPLLQAGVAQLRGAASPETMNRLAKGTLSAFGVFVDILLVIFLSIYLALDPALYRRGLVMLFPKGARLRVGNALDDAGNALHRWLMGQLFAMVCVGTLTAIGLHLVGVPLAVALGILLGIMDFVPVVGPFIAAIPGVLVAFAQSPQLALYAALVYLSMQFIEGHFILPLAQRWALALPPALTLLGIVAFGLLFGPIGLLLAMPLIVVTVTLVNRLYVEAL